MDYSNVRSMNFVENKNSKMKTTSFIFICLAGLYFLGPNLGPTIVSSTSTKVDCHPLDGASEDKCKKLGCIWSPVNEEPNNKPQVFGSQFEWSPLIGDPTPKPDIKEPWCYYPSSYEAYKISELGHHQYELNRIRESGVPNDINKLKLSMSKGDKTLRIRIEDPTHKRYEPDLPKLNISPNTKENSLYDVSVDPKDHHLKVWRKKQGHEAGHILAAPLQNMIFSDKFIQINLKLSSQYIFGLGEHYDNFSKKADSYKAYGFYHTDKLPLPGGRRSYGSFPFLINLSTDHKKAVGIYLHNSNGMDIIIQPDNSITFRTVGGILDFLVFTGPTANDVIRQYQQTVGLPDLPPRWSLGFHLCRYNYGSIDRLKEVWNRTRNSGIPFDVQWTDIDYMENGNDFTYDHDKFKGLPEFVNHLHDIGMHYVPILDPGVSQEAGYEPYEIGVKLDAFIKNATGQTLVGTVWNKSGRTVFPDFTSEQGKKLWSIMFEKFYQQLKFDGAWIDMNEISNFVDGSLEGCPDFEELYHPGGYALKTKTLCPNAVHAAGLEYDIHNRFSFYEAIATSEALKNVQPNKRPFIISRASAPGQGHYGGHWSGDVLSTWDYLRWSIVSSIEHSMYGFNMMGSDICGFTGDTERELCARWSSLGAFYTFSRNHNDDKSIDQDPVALGSDVIEAARNALTMRYSLLPYLYSLIHRAHRFGEPAIRSTGLEFHQTDPIALDAELQFMWGRDMIVSPVVLKGSNSKETYLPKGRWFEFSVLPLEYMQKTRPARVIDSKGQWHLSKNVSIHDIPIFFRGGSIIPVYRNVKQTVPETVNQPFGLDIFREPGHKAHGQIFIDDGESLNNKYNKIVMEFDDENLIITTEVNSWLDQAETKFGIVNVYKCGDKVKSVSVEGKKLSFLVEDGTLSFDLTGYSTSKDKTLVVSFEYVN